MTRRSKALGAAVAESATRYLYIWLLIAIFVEYARPASYLPFLRIPLLYSAIPLGLLLVSSFAKGLRPVKEIFSDPLSKWVLIFLGLIAFAVLHADVTLYVWATFKTVLGYVFMFIMIARIATTEARLRGVIIALFLAHLFLLAMNPQVLLDPNQRHYIEGASFLGDGNDFALSLCLLIPLAMEFAPNLRSRWLRIAAWAGVAVLLIAIIGTQSRGGTLGIVAAFAYLWWRSPRKMLALVGVGVAVTIMLIYAPPAYFDRMESISTYQEDGSAQGRLEAWKASVNMALDNPLTGVGAGHFPTAFGTEYRTPGAESMPWLTAHSSYFLVLGEIGFPGLLCILMLVFGNILANARMQKDVMARAGPEPSPDAVRLARMLRLFTAGGVGLAVAGAFLSAAYYPHFYVMTALFVAARCITREQGAVPALARYARPAGKNRRPHSRRAGAGSSRCSTS